MDLTLFGFRADFDPNNKILKQEPFIYRGEEYFISTVDLGVDHGYEGIPLYYETMIFKDDWSDLFCDRYLDKETALKGHENVLNDIENEDLVLVDGYFEYRRTE